MSYLPPECSRVSTSTRRVRGTSSSPLFRSVSDARSTAILQAVLRSIPWNSISRSSVARAAPGRAGAAAVGIAPAADSCRMIRAMTRLAPRTFARKLQWAVGLAACAVLAGSAWINYRSSVHALEEQTDLEALKQVGAAAGDLDDFINKVGMIPRGMAARQEAIR